MATRLLIPFLVAYLFGCTLPSNGAAAQETPENVRTNAPMGLAVAPGQVRIGGRLTVTLTNVPPGIGDKLKDTNKIAVLLRGIAFQHLCRESRAPAPGVVRLGFRLSFDATNRADWSDLLSSAEPLEAIPVGVVLPNGSELSVAADRLPTITLLAFDRNRKLLVGSLFCLFVYLFLYLACRSNLIRDVAVNQPAGEPENTEPLLFSRKGTALISLLMMVGVILVSLLAVLEKISGGWCALCVGAFLLIHYFFLRSTPAGEALRPFSLARTQMAIWFALIVCAWVGLWLATGALNTLTDTVLVLMGIGAGIALGAEAQDAGKPSRAETLRKRKDELEKKKREGARLDDTEQAELNALPAAIAEALRPPTSNGFFDDVLTDASGISFHRLQMLVWTLVLAAVFVAEVVHNLSMPEFSTTMLALMGISSGTYLGFMLKESHSSDQSRETTPSNERAGKPSAKPPEPPAKPPEPPAKPPEPPKPGEICDAIITNLNKSGLKYGVPGWQVRDMLNGTGGMCGGWYQMFQHLAHCQGVFIDRRFYEVDVRSMAKGETKWNSIVIRSGGLNQPQPTYSSGAFLKEDTEPVTSEFLNRVFPDGGHGDLYRFDDEWWFTDDWDRNSRDADWSYKGTDDPLHYRTEWQKHTREAEDDYSALIAFFKVYSSGQYTQQQIEQHLDPMAVLQMAAVRGYIGDWDSFTMFRGKNGYFFRRPTDGRFQFLQWDSDLAFRAGNYPFYSDRVASWLERPYNLPLFKKYLLELAQFTESARLATWLELEAAAVPERPVTPQFYKTFFRQRNRFLKMTGGTVHMQ